jgi:hypothetical protein
VSWSSGVFGLMAPTHSVPPMALEAFSAPALMKIPPPRRRGSDHADRKDSAVTSTKVPQETRSSTTGVPSAHRAGIMDDERAANLATETVRSLHEA